MTPTQVFVTSVYYRYYYKLYKETTTRWKLIYVLLLISVGMRDEAVFENVFSNVFNQYLFCSFVIGLAVARLQSVCDIILLGRHSDRSIGKRRRNKIPLPSSQAIRANGPYGLIIQQPLHGYRALTSLNSYR